MKKWATNVLGWGLAKWLIPAGLGFCAGWLVPGGSFVGALLGAGIAGFGAANLYNFFPPEG